MNIVGKGLSFQKESCVQRHQGIRGVAEISKKERSLRGREKELQQL